MSDDLSKYKDAYLSEARIHVRDMNLALIKWEKHPGDNQCLQDIFRMSHTLKSISAAMGYEQVAQLSHAIEDLLDALRHKKIQLNDVADLLFNCFDFLELSLKELTEEKAEPDSHTYIEKIQALMRNDSAPIEAPALNQTPAMEAINTIEVKVERLDKLLNLTKELLVNKLKLETLSEAIQLPELAATVDIMNRAISELQYHVMQIRLVPIGFIFRRFTRLVRDLARQQNKEVDLYTEGDNIEVDRSLIDAISESLAHLIKNALDHGLESPTIRLAAKKPAVGIIKLTAAREKDSLIIEVSDDGAGLDLKGIKKKAMQQNMVVPKTTSQEVANIIFEGLSTTERVTSISGRGLGMSIVKKKIESIHGTITVSTKEETGTLFIIKIPLTLAVILVLLIKQANYTYAIPLSSIERLITVKQKDIKGLLDKKAIIYNRTNIPIVHLSKIFNSNTETTKERQSLVVLRRDDSLLGVVVDELLTTEEIVTQPINTGIKGSKLFSGTALLGTGETILILDTEQLFQASASLKKISPQVHLKAKKN